MPVNTPRSEYDNTFSQWKRLRDCFGGKDKVLAAGSTYAPDLKGLDTRGNKSYRERGNFFNATKRTVIGLTGAIFQKNPTFEVSPDIDKYLDDITLTGIRMPMFALTATKEVMLVARYGILVDLARENTSEQRPYLIGFTAEDIVNWDTTVIDGDAVLTLLVLKEHVRQPKEDDPFIFESVERYRECRLTLADTEDGKPVYSQQLWTKDKDSAKWIPEGPPIVAQRRGSPLSFIPFVFFGSNSTTPEISEPPLLDLANVNLAHWRNSCDHEQGLHIVALPTPYVAGMKASDGDDDELGIGPSFVWELEKEGSAGMVEFSGAGLASLVTAMEKKEKQMAVIGAKLLEEQSGGAETAFAVGLRHSGEHATLRTIAQSMEQGFSSVLQIMAWWDGIVERPTDIEVTAELNKAFAQIKATPQEVQVALTALQSDEISYETFWNLLTEGGWARDGVTAEEERREIERQGEPRKTEGPNPIDVIAAMNRNKEEDE